MVAPRYSARRRPQDYIVKQLSAPIFNGIPTNLFVPPEGFPQTPALLPRLDVAGHRAVFDERSDAAAVLLYIYTKRVASDASAALKHNISYLKNGAYGTPIVLS